METLILGSKAQKQQYVGPTGNLYLKFQIQKWILQNKWCSIFLFLSLFLSSFHSSHTFILIVLALEK